MERQLKAFVPRPMLTPPAKPKQADQVLDALAVVFKPGDRVGNRAIVSAARTSLLVAGQVRRWARSEGLWPYRDAPTGFDVLADRSRKGGAL